VNKPAITPKPFSLLVKPTSADCNLQCTYCFYLEKHRLYPNAAKHRMSEAVLEKMIRGYLATDQSVHTFVWQGGEPMLMGIDFFHKIIELQKKHGRAGTRIANGIQTNATLINDREADFFARHGFLVGCSLDGPAQNHDWYRRTLGGGPSHAAVLKGIANLKRYGVEFNVLIMVTQANVNSAKDVYRYLIDQGIYYHQYIPCVEFDAKGSLQPYAIRGGQWGDFMCEIFDLWYSRDHQTVSVRHFDSILQKLVDGSCNVCTLADNCCQYFVVEYNGDIYPCDFFVREDLKLGNIMSMSWDETLFNKIYREFGTRKSHCEPACLTCDCWDLCMGDCPKYRVREPSGSHNISWLCNGWQQLIRHCRYNLQDMAENIRESQIRANQRLLRSKSSLGKIGSSTGRNQPCPCGSGKKYKKCCGA
jgi:uncharacterized protein